MLQEVYKRTKSSTYFKYYLNCLVQLERYAEAESEIQKEIKKQRPPKPELYIHWGYVLKVQGKTDEADEKYSEAIEKIANNKGQYLVAASNFLSWAEYNYAKQTYLKGRENLVGEQFNYELARSYLYLRDYDNMMEEYLNLLRVDEKQLARVQRVCRQPPSAHTARSFVLRARSPTQRRAYRRTAGRRLSYSPGRRVRLQAVRR